MKLRIICLIFALLVSACTPLDDNYSEYRGYNAKQLYHRGLNDLQQEDYQQAVKDFEALEIIYPFNPNAEQAHLNMIYAYYKAGDRASTMAASERYIHFYQGSGHMDYAYYMRAMSNYYHERPILHKLLKLDESQRDLSLAKKAFMDFKYLRHRYPHSIYAKDAQYKMIKLYGLLSKSEYRIAHYYYQRGAYVASANRAANLVNHYEQSVLTPKALALMVRSYRKLDLPQKANEAMSVLSLSFPHHPEYIKLLEEAHATSNAHAV